MAANLSILYAIARALSELLYNFFVPVICHEAQLLVGPTYTLRGERLREITRGRGEIKNPQLFDP